MKIALVTPYDYPYPGGVTEHIRHLDRGFAPVGTRPVLLHPRLKRRPRRTPTSSQ